MRGEAGSFVTSSKGVGAKVGDCEGKGSWKQGQG